MDKNLSRIVWLLQHEWMGGLNEAEKGELGDILKNESMRRVYEEMKQNLFVVNRFDEYKQYSAQQAYQIFSEQCRPKRKLAWSPWVISAVAAMIIMCVGITILWERQADTVTLAVVNELPVPGSRKATLRLASGECIRIEGDSTQVKENDGVKIKYSNGGISYQVLNPGGELVYNELMVPVASECFVVLDDGTKVWMNSDSKLKYPVKFIGKDRKVFLEGEAYFEVTKAAKPFIVNTSLGDVQVLGTSFNVKAYREEEKVWTTLVTGSVKFVGKGTLQIEPGQQIIASKDGSFVKRDVNIEEYVGWRSGLFVFKDQRLEDIMRDLVRWYDIQVHFQYESLKDIQFTGNLKRYDRVNVLMELLKRTNELNYSITGNSIILYK